MGNNTSAAQRQPQQPSHFRSMLDTPVGSIRTVPQPAPQPVVEAQPAPQWYQPDPTPAPQEERPEEMDDGASTAATVSMPEHTGAPLSVLSENLFDNGRQQTGVDRSLLDNPSVSAVVPGAGDDALAQGHGGSGTADIAFDAIDSRHVAHLLSENMHSGPDPGRGTF